MPDKAKALLECMAYVAWEGVLGSIIFSFHLGCPPAVWSDHNKEGMEALMDGRTWAVLEEPNYGIIRVSLDYTD